MIQTNQTARATDSTCAALESSDHLTKKICALWGTPELNVFIRHLLLDSRDGSRQGLPKDVAAELTFLAETNTFVRAITRVERLGIKFSEALTMVEAEDNQPLKFDALDEPYVSRDTLVNKKERERFNSAALTPVPRHSKRAPTKNKTTGLLTLLLMLFGNKWLWIIALVVADYHFVWPWMQTLR